MATNEVKDLQSLAPELLCQIFESCDTFEQALSLASTSRRLCDVWRSNESTILTAIAERCIPAFDEAVVAACVTELVTKVFKEGRLPPKSDDIDIASFSIKACHLRASDMFLVLRFHQLAKAMERSFLPTNTKAKYFGYDDSPHSPELERKMSVSFHRAVYRVLLSGPMLTGWYLEPFCVDGHLADPLLRYTGGYNYLESHLAYDLDANIKLSPELDRIYGSLSSWLISSMKEHLTSEDLQWTQKMPTFLESAQLQSIEVGLLGISNTNKDEIGAMLREVMNMILAIDILHNMKCRYQKNCEAHWHRSGVEEDLVRRQLIYPPPEEERGLSTCKNLDKMTVVILGVYQPEELRINHDLGLVGTRFIAHGRTRSPVPLDWDAGRYRPVSQWIIHIQLLQSCESGSVNQIDGEFAWREDLQLFAFTLNRYFKIQLAPYSQAGGGLLEILNWPTPWSRMSPHAAPSAPIWLKLLVPTPKAPVYSFERVEVL